MNSRIILSLIKVVLGVLVLQYHGFHLWGQSNRWARWMSVMVWGVLFLARKKHPGCPPEAFKKPAKWHPQSFTRPLPDFLLTGTK